MAATLSLEPLLHVLPWTTSTSLFENSEALSSPEQQHSLAARLQRLWQERGDFSKLSIDKLELEEEKEKDDEQEEAGHDDAFSREVEKTDQAGNEQDTADKLEQAAEEQSMSQEQLWDLKLGILQGLECVLLC